MTIKNKSTLGTPSFIKEFCQDCKSGIATGWWNERFARKGERVSIVHNQNTLTTVYDLINYIKNNTDEISQEDIEVIADKVYQAYPSLAFKRAYFWEVDESSLKEEVETLKEEVVVEQEEPEEEFTEEEPSKPEKPIPNFEYAKTIEDKQELKAYAKEFGFKLDSRKSQSDMMKSFQGKFHASKGK